MDIPAPQYVPVILPSRGALYGGVLPGGSVDIRKLTVAEDIAIQSVAGGSDLISRLLGACCRFPAGFSQSNLLVADRVALLIAIRVFTFGAKYTVPYVCEHCNASTKGEIDLSTGISERVTDGPLVEPVEVTLTDCQRTVSLKFLRGSDEDELSKVAKRAKGDPAEEIITRMALQIAQIDGQTVLMADREKFVRSMSIPDSLDFRDAIEKAQPGMDMAITLTCPQCGGENGMNLPFNSEFFRPSRRRG